MCKGDFVAKYVSVMAFGGDILGGAHTVHLYCLIQSLVCDCTIVLEIMVGSVQFSHFKSLSTSFLGLLCNSFGA